MLRKFILLSAGIAMITFASCDSKNKEKRNAERAPVRVETLTVNSRDVANSNVFSGTIEEGEGSVLSFSTAGTIKRLDVKEGSRVSQGQVLATVDDSSLRSAYEIAKATLAQAQDAYDRMKILHDANSLPAIKWVDVQQKLIQAQNAVDIAENALNDAILRAPFSGIVSEKFADQGQVAAPGVPVVKLIKINDVKAVISIPQSDIANFKTGESATITVTDNPSVKYKGVLVEKGVTANSLSRAYDVKYRIDNKEGDLLPGMICNVSVEGKELTNVIILPQNVVLLDERNNNFVWVDSANIARKRIVKVGNMNDYGLEILAGLSANDKVIIKGQHKVCNGTKVESINE